MNTVEDLLRAATRAEAARMRAVRPLRLPAPGPAPARRPAFRPALRPGRWRGWLVPATAAVAVLAVAVSLVIVRDISNGPVVPPTASGSAVPPQYYVAVSGLPVGWYAYAPLSGENDAPSNDLVVGDTVSGRKLGTLAAPTGTEWAGVTAAADDQTFVALAEPTHSGPDPAGGWYRVLLTPGAGSPARLTKLPIKALSGIGAMALSGSGKELAVVIAARPSATNPNQTGEKSLCVYSVATGDLARPCWSTDTTENNTFFFSGGYQSGQLNQSLTWTDGDNAIAFPASEAVPIPHSKHFEGRQTVRSLNLTAKGTSLAADSKVIWSETNPPQTNPLCGSATPAVSADGKTVVCATYTQLTGRDYPWRIAWLTFPTSAAAHPGGRPVTDYQFTMRNPWQGLGWMPPLWADPSGSVLLVAWLLEKNGRDFTHFGVIRAGKFTALPMPSTLAALPDFFTSTPTRIAW